MTAIPAEQYEAHQSEMRESVAVHQAACECHPEPDGRNTEIDCESVYSSAADLNGEPWHIDPLCDARMTGQA